jgi:hypothetical protein
MKTPTSDGYWWYETEKTQKMVFVSTVGSERCASGIGRSVHTNVKNMKGEWYGPVTRETVMKGLS